VSADSGTIATWAARYIQVRDGMQFSLSGTLATMANSLPYSLCAAIAFPNRHIISIVGDGGFTIEDPATAPAILREALEYDGPAVVQAVIDPNEPPLPGNVTVKQAVKFGEALLRGQKDRWEIIKTVAKDKIREVI